MWDNFNKRVHDIEVGRRAKARVCTYTRCIEGLEYALKQHNTKRSDAPSGLLTRYLEESLHQMEMLQQRASARGGLKRYWREGVRKMKVHLATAKALEHKAERMSAHTQTLELQTRKPGAHSLKRLVGRHSWCESARKAQT